MPKSAVWFPFALLWFSTSTGEIFYIPWSVDSQEVLVSSNFKTLILGITWTSQSLLFYAISNWWWWWVLGGVLGVIKINAFRIKYSSFEPWSRSQCGFPCFAYCQEYLTFIIAISLVHLTSHFKNLFLSVFLFSKLNQTLEIYNELCFVLPGVTSTADRLLTIESSTEAFLTCMVSISHPCRTAHKLTGKVMATVSCALTTLVMISSMMRRMDGFSKCCAWAMAGHSSASVSQFLRIASVLLLHEPEIKWSAPCKAQFRLKCMRR